MNRIIIAAALPGAASPGAREVVNTAALATGFQGAATSAGTPIVADSDILERSKKDAAADEMRFVIPAR